MHIEECYQEMGGDYADVCTRLPSPRLIQRFVLKFPEDPSFEMLRSAMEAGDRAEAFRAAHTLKGVCANLSLARLLASASALTEVLRPEADAIPAAAPALMEKVCADYRHTIDVIRKFEQAQ